MTKRYKMLQKKLQDLELDLAHTISKTEPDTEFHSERTEYFQNQFAFLNNLLSAEITSNPSRPHHLSHIRRRLTELRAKFDDWELNRVGSDPVETGSTGSGCSCTESCLNDDGDEAEPEAFYELEPEEELFFEADPGRVNEEVETGENETTWDWGSGSVLAGGVAVGTGLIMGLLGQFYGYLYYYVYYHGCLVPT